MKSYLKAWAIVAVFVAGQCLGCYWAYLAFSNGNIPSIAQQITGEGAPEGQEGREDLHCRTADGIRIAIGSPDDEDRWMEAAQGIANGRNEAVAVFQGDDFLCLLNPDGNEIF